jgi:glucuronosyltransferase
LVITELFNTDCYVAFAYKFQVPFISIVTTPLLPWGYERFANPDNPSYNGNLFLGHSDRMSFLERLVNTIYLKKSQWEYHYWFDLPSDAIARKYFGESLPPLVDIVRNTSLVLVNRHFSLNQPVPNVPAVIEVGGIHVQIPKKLPEVSEELVPSKLPPYSVSQLRRSPVFEPRSGRLLFPLPLVPQSPYLSSGARTIGQ